MKEGINISFTEEEVELAQSLEVKPISKMVTPQGTFPMAETGFKDDEEDNLQLS